MMEKPEENEEATIKILNTEIDVMSSIEHPNIINLLDYSFHDCLVKQTGECKEVFYLALELATGGELFDFIAETGNFTEEVARYYFHQIIDALEYLNCKGISHRDIKPENIMLDQDYNIKLADFGFSSTQPLNSTRKGTMSYMSTEINEGKEYSRHYADIFATGVILFLMISRHPPFCKADISDPHYRLIMGNRVDLFWKLHSKNKAPGFYSDNLIDLMSSIFAYSPLERPSLAEIKASNWYNECVPSYEEIKDEFEYRKSRCYKLTG
jgi:serine/threonine protein kinase